MSALQLFRNLPYGKSEQKSFSQQIINEITGGNVNPLDVDLRLKAMADTIELVRKDKDVQQLTIEEAEKYGKTFDHAGCSITVTGRTTKDFTGIDPVLDEMYSDLERLKARIKAREATIEAGMNPETGEMFAPVKKSVTTFLTYKFK